jgi:hypothetical protein
MANFVSHRQLASVNLLTIEISEDELAVLAAALNYVLDHCDDQALDELFGAERGEIEGIRDDHTFLLDEFYQADEAHWDAQFAASPDKLDKLVQQAIEEIERGETTEMILTDDGRMLPG